MLIKDMQQVFCRMGAKPALLCDGQEMSYRELDRLSSQVAAELRARGIGREDIVPVLLERGAGYVAAVLGILKAGAAFLCLVADYPSERVAFIARDCGAKLILDAVFMERAYRQPQLYSAGAGDEEAAAMVVYTSGSTGRPKGILLSVRSVAAALRRTQRIMENTAADVHASAASFSFVAFLVDILLPLCAGETIRLFTEAERRDLGAIEAGIEESGVTMLFLAPSTLCRMQRFGSSIRTIITSGEPLHNFCGQGWRLLNLYGMSEMPITACYFLVDRPYEQTPIGRPASDIRLYLVDAAGQLVPPGQEGEICIAGPIARGYINRPELTAQVFTANPFSREKGFERLLHTGDIGKILPDGNLLYVNRRDWQVKINGQRVEIGEIETVMMGLAGMEQAVVRAFVNKRGQNYLCAFYTAGEDLTAELPALLREKLPDYMVPRQFVHLAAFPRNANGKVDRQALQPPLLAQSDYKAPKTALEKNICTGLARVLQLPRVGMEDNFFVLGGDSLAAMELAVWLQESVPAIGSADIYDHPTPRELAAFLMEQAGAPVLPPLQPGDSTGPFPMSEAQVMMARFSLAMEKDGINHRQADINGWYDISREMVDGRRLAAAVQRTREDFEVFRLGYDLRSFTLQPASRGELQLTLEEQGESYRLRLHGSHLFMDDEFNQLLLRHIQDCYEGRSPEAFVRFRDYVGWMRSLQKTALYEEAEAYYEAMRQRLGTGRFVPHPMAEARKWKCIAYTMGIGKPRGIERCIRQLRCSEYVLYLALYMRQLSRRQGGVSGCFSVLNLRLLPELKKLEGCGTNRFYLCHDAREATLAESAAEIYDGMRKAMRFCIYPAWHIMDPEGREFPYAAFNYAETDRSSQICLGGQPLSERQLAYSDYIDIPLLLQLEKQQGGMKISFLGREDMTNPRELQEMAAEYAAALERLTAEEL